MTWKFELEYDTVTTEIDEPMGFNEIVFSLQRDDRWHGVFLEASTSQLGFYGTAATILQTAKGIYGVDAEVIFTASLICDGQTEYTKAISGKLNFADWRENCGTDCIIYLAVERNTCSMVFKNRFDQKVNIDSNLAFDKQTLLPEYAALNFEMDLATQVIPISADADVVPEGDTFTTTDLFGAAQSFTMVRPTYGLVTDNSIRTGQLNDPFSNYQQGDGPILISPQVLMEENEVCVPGNWTYNVRMKGRVKLDSDSGGDVIASSYLVFGYWDGVGIVNNTIVDIEPEITIQNPMTFGVFYEFDETYTGTVALPEGVGVYAFLKYIVTGLDERTYTVIYDQETSFFLGIDKQCPTTSAEVCMVNETLARLTEAITDSCLTVYSEYYGRIDSQPYEFDSNGCGGLRVVTPGLKIRQATDKSFFLSMDELMSGLRAIDNIGMGMEANSETGYGEWVRIEPVRYFYQDIKLLTLPYIPKAVSEIQEMLVFSNIKTGYNKWAIESVKGIDEFNSYKERRTGIKSINNELDISCDLIASGYIIETLRSSTLAITGEKDTTYDDETFIICVERDTDPQTRESFFGVSTPGQFFFAKAGGAFFAPGSVVQISGTALNNGTYHIIDVVTDNWGLYYTTTEATVSENFINATYTQVSGFFGITTVEQGNISNASDFYSPATAYNWRIRPFYNIMRWFKSIAQAYVNLSNTTSKLFFTFGKGNYKATGELTTPDACKLENGAYAEDKDLSRNEFAGNDWMPIYKPETIQFEYPLSVADYLAIKANPYGYIEYQCGTGEYLKGYIKTMEYKPVEGQATFTLLKKWL